MARPIGSPKLGGRKKGTPNKINAEIRDMISNALEKAGGEDYLLRQSEENPVAFMTLIGKIIPKNVDANLTINGSAKPIVFRVIKPDDKANKD